MKMQEFNLWSDIPEKDYLNIKHLKVNEKSIVNYNILKKLINLEILDISHNKLTSFDGKQLCEINNLKELYLYCNNLTSFNGTRLNNLELLDLCSNKLTSFDGIELINLEILDMRNNKFLKHNVYDNSYFVNSYKTKKNMLKVVKNVRKEIIHFLW